LDLNRRKELFPPKLIPYIYGLKEKTGELKLLEVGSGPLSRLAWGADEGLFQITAIDPLAKLYSQLLRRHRYDYPVKPIACSGEGVSGIFDRESFDIGYSRNALDHAVSPRTCLEGMRHVLRKGGIIFLEGFVREGTRQGRRGLHRHDLVPEKGHLIRYDKRGVATNLTGDMGLKCLYSVRGLAGGGEEYIIVFEKE
jgi:SAM-dependent methyltransferase